MKKSLILLLLLLSASFSLRGQFYYYGDNSQLTRATLAVVDSTSAEPLPFASVYLTEAKDSSIANFTLTDADGKAVLKDIPFGAWKLHVEMMGFKPWVKEMNFKKSYVDLGFIRLHVDEQFIRAARVTEAGNPIIIKKDTLEYVASAFQVGSNAVLKDLLARMPGIDFTDDGKVKVNGEEVSRITVNGKTFFFGDQSMALDNLPAAVVDKIRVIDKKSDEARISGKEDGKREKVMDVALKKEYESGWFGNVGLKGGTTLDGKDKPLRDNRGFLFHGNALVSTYNPKDQLTLLANGLNISDNSRSFYINSEEVPSVSGLSTQATAGANVATTRLKGIETAASTSYKFRHTDAARKTLRTVFQEGGDVLSESDNNSFQRAHNAGANLEIKKEEGNLNFSVRTGYQWTQAQTETAGTSRTSLGEAMLNHSDQRDGSDFIIRNFNVFGNIGYSGIGNNSRRSIIAYGSYSHDGTGGTSWDRSSTWRGTASPEKVDIHYDRNRSRNTVSANLTYYEPIGEQWRLMASAAFRSDHSQSRREAFQADESRDDYYSSVSDNNYIAQNYGIGAAYEKDALSISASVLAEGVQNHMYSQSYGVLSDTGAGQWDWHLRPEVDFSWSKNTTMMFVSLYSFQNTPSRENMLPTLNISDPTRLKAGNIYLQPEGIFSGYGQLRIGFPKQFASFNLSVNALVTTRPVMSAMWYDKDGIRYAVPVNSRKPSAQVWLGAGYNTPLNKEKSLTLSLDLSGSFRSSTSYHSVTPQAPLDREKMDYTALMDAFWGDASGSRFYSGESGFAENTTRSFGSIERIHLKYNKGPWSVTVGYTNALNLATYTLPGSQNVFTSENRAGLAGQYRTPHKWEIGTELNYNFFLGYAEGYGLPEWHWDMTLSKNIGAFTLSLTAHDILGQTRNLSHIDASDYKEDSYRLIMGRYFLLGFKWNFGKMNALQNSRANRAASIMQR